MDRKGTVPGRQGFLVFSAYLPFMELALTSMLPLPTTPPFPINTLHVVFLALFWRDSKRNTAGQHVVRMRERC